MHFGNETVNIIYELYCQHKLLGARVPLIDKPTQIFFN